MEETGWGEGKECDRGREEERKRKESYGEKEENLTEGGRKKGRKRKTMGRRKRI